MRTSSTSWIHLLILSALSVLSLVVLKIDQPALCLKSPISPVTTHTLPDTQDMSYTPQTMPGVPITPPARRLPRLLLSELVWSSPLPWIPFGVIVFGALAWLLIALLRRTVFCDT
jgi:hypothetical protein